MKTQLEPQELKLIANLIDVASQKGMFRGNELLTMGLLHKKIVDMLEEIEVSAKEFDRQRANSEPNVPETSEIPKDPKESSR